MTFQCVAVELNYIFCSHQERKQFIMMMLNQVNTIYTIRIRITMIFNDKRIPDNELLIFARDLDVTTVCTFLLFLLL